jgi:regulator of sigma E protease
MNSFLVSLAAFIVAIGVLVTIHEFGHFWVARRLGVKVLRFSIGFGKPLWQRTFGADKTELVIAAIPLVMFAIVAYWVMFVSGVPGLKPVVGDVLPASYAAVAGIRSGDEIFSIAGKPTPTWEAAVLTLLDTSLDGQESIAITVVDSRGAERHLQVQFETADELLKKGGVLENFGVSPWRPPAVIERLVEGSAGERAGLLAGDEVVMADGVPVSSWGQWVDIVRERPGQAIAVQVLRNEAETSLEITPDSVLEDGQTIGRIGAYVRLPSAEQRATMRVVVRYGPFQAVPQALKKTWNVTTLTLRTLWKMVSGKASVENLSGPISIARYAGQSASIGLAAFLGFLGIVSVSLGVLNLLPIPVLDGGHLLFYLLELVKGSPVSEVTQMAGQRIGIALLVALMSLAFYNDLIRLLE